MRKTLLVMRQELIATFSRPSYLFFAYGIPIIAVLVLSVVNIIQSKSTENTAAAVSSETEFQLETEGFVDDAGLIQTISDDFQDHLLRYETEDLAKQALQSGEISAFYIIPEDYLASGQVDYVYPDDRSYLSDGQQWVIKSVLNFNLLDGDSELADQIWNPIQHLEVRNLADEFNGGVISREDCSRPGADCESNELIRLMPSILVVIFFIAFMSSSNMLFASIGTEKENRTIELLMLSISPRQLLAGKTLALGIAGLSQTLVWLSAIYFSLNMGGSILKLPVGFVFPVEIVAWGLVFFIGGFALYASLMAGAGALVPKMKESGIANHIAMAPLFFGYIYGLFAPLVGATTSPLTAFLSFLPLTSPVVMVMRLTDSLVPLWHLLLSVVLLFIAAYLTFQVIAAMFNAQNLLSGQPFSARRYLRALTGRL
ncbi:MAG: ABC transporter permease [Chloroflexota bacterium]